MASDSLPTPQNGTRCRRSQVLLIEDEYGSEATGTARFPLDDVVYETGLNDEHAQQPRDQVAVWPIERIESVSN